MYVSANHDTTNSQSQIWHQEKFKFQKVMKSKTVFHLNLKLSTLLNSLLNDVQFLSLSWHTLFAVIRIST